MESLKKEAILNFRPQLVEDEHGAELELADILFDFYSSHGLNLESAAHYTEKYCEAFVDNIEKVLTAGK